MCWSFLEVKEVCHTLCAYPKISDKVEGTFSMCIQRESLPFMSIKQIKLFDLHEY